MTLQTVAEHPEHGIAVWPNFTEPTRLWELEGECQRAGWTFFCREGLDQFYWVADQPTHSAFASLTEPATPEGRVRLVLRAWLQMQAPWSTDSKGRKYLLPNNPLEEAGA